MPGSTLPKTPAPFLCSGGYTHRDHSRSWWTMPVKVHWVHFDHDLGFQLSFRVAKVCSMLKPVLIPSPLHLSSFIKVHPLLMWWSEGSQVQIPESRQCCEVPGGMRSVQKCHGSDNTQHYVPTNFIQLNLLAVLARDQIALRHTLAFPILQHPQSGLRSLSKRNPIDGSAFAWGRNNSDCFLQHILYVHCRNFIPFYCT